MRRKTLAIIVAAAAVVSQFSVSLTAAGSETGTPSNAGDTVYEELAVEPVSGNLDAADEALSYADDYSIEEVFVTSDSSEEALSSDSGEADETLQAADITADSLFEDEDAAAEEDPAPDALGEGLMLAAADVYVGPLEDECKEYTFTEDLSRFGLVPSATGTYHFVGTGINSIAVYDEDSNAVKTFSDSVMDSDLWFVAAQLEAGKQYYVIISREDVSGGAFYYYKAPGFCVKVTLKDGMTGEELDDFNQIITYVDFSGNVVSSTNKLMDGWNQSGNPVCKLEGQDAYCYFPIGFPIPEFGHEAEFMPVDNQDGTYYVRAYDPLTGDELGHCWDEGTVTATATCAEPGSRTRTCLCGATREEKIPTTSEHTWTDWQVKSEATIFSPKILEHTCSTCGKKEEQEEEGGSALPSHIYVNADLVSLKKGQKTTAFKVTMDEGDYLTGCTVKKPKIAAVTWNKNGVAKIKGKNPGKTTVTLMTAAGALKNFTVKVTKKDVKTTAVKVTNPEVVNKTLTLSTGQKLKLATELVPFTSKDKVTYTSKNAKIAKVTKRGLITAKRPGKTRIIVKAGKKQYKLTVIVN